MRIRTLALAALIGLPALASAQISAGIRIDLPVVLPQLVVVSPGVQVVPDIDEEVFFSDGYYWCRRDDGWYRSRSHRGGWAVVPAGRVPGRLMGLPPPGHFRHWKAEKEEMKHERKMWKEQEKHERKEEKRARKHGDDDRGGWGFPGGRGGRGHGRD